MASLAKYMAVPIDELMQRPYYEFLTLYEAANHIAEKEKQQWQKKSSTG